MNTIALEKRENACRPEYDSKITTGAQQMHVRGEFWPNLVSAQYLILCGFVHLELVLL